MGDTCFKDLVSHSKSTRYSLIIDEQTDLSTIKHLVLIARFYDINIQKTHDQLLNLLQVKDCTAQGIYSSMINFFAMNGIHIENWIGFASNASVMMGGKGSVKATLETRIPALLVQCCACHSMHLQYVLLKHAMNFLI